MIQLIEGIAIGLAVGVFCPAIARKIKALISKEATVVKTDVVNQVAKKL